MYLNAIVLNFMSPFKKSKNMVCLAIRNGVADWLLFVRASVRRKRIM